LQKESSRGSIKNPLPFSPFCYDYEKLKISLVGIMKKHSHYQHFEDKTPLEHLKTARKKGQLASESVHGVEPSGAIVAGTDAARETVVFLSMLAIFLSSLALHPPTQLLFLGLFCLMLLVWKTSRSAFWGWACLEKVHHLIQQEKWEIEHHRAQEKEELMELYHTKGFKDKQLQEVVEVLMADDNRLLQIMLEEELGLSLGSFEHPLRQCLGAALSVIITSIVCLGSLWLFGVMGMIIASLCILLMAGFLSAKQLGNDKIKSIVWTLAIGALSVSLPYVLLKIVLHR
jgi:vacuolar iron transporter family protein